MKKLKELKIIKKQLPIIKNEDIEIENLIIGDVVGFTNDFYLENIQFFIDKKLIYNCQSIITNFDKEKIKPYLEELINVIADSNNYNIMIDLLNYNMYRVKDNDKRPLKDFEKKEALMIGKIRRSEDPIVYLRAAMYNYGMRWKFYSNIPFQERNKIEDIILSYDFKKYNLQYEINRYFDKTQEPHTYFELLLTYCRDYFNGHRWPEAEQRVFKFAPCYMEEYINQVVKWRDNEIEDILFEMNEPQLYFNYAKNNLKGDWEKLRTDKYLKDQYNPSKEKIIDAALDSIASSPYHVMAYTREVTKERLPLKMEEKMLTELNKNINYYHNKYFHFEDITTFYNYMKNIKENFPLFEEFLVKLNNLRDGLKLDEPYKENENEDEDIFDENTEYEKILDQVIYNYILTNRDNKVWIEIGINNKSDLLKLRKKIVDNGIYDIRPSGYGELDY